MTIRNSFSSVFITCYEGDPPAGDPPKTFNQEQVNGFLAGEKKKWQATNEKLATDLEALKNEKGTTEAAKAALEVQIEELRSASMSSEQRIAAEQKKLATKHAEQVSTLQQQAQGWQSRYQAMHIGHDLTSAYAGADVLPTSVPFIDSYLAGKSRLVDVLDDDGKPTGHFVTKVKMTVIGKDDKPAEVEVLPVEAMKIMKEDTEQFGFLFKNTASGGLGGGNGKPGKKVPVEKMSPAQFMKARKDGTLYT